MKYKTYSEKDICEPGWYYFIPEHYKKFDRPRFAEVDQDAIDEKWLQCKKYAGSYIGPVDMKDFGVDE